MMSILFNFMTSSSKLYKEGGHIVLIQVNDPFVHHVEMHASFMLKTAKRTVLV